MSPSPGEGRSRRLRRERVIYSPSRNGRSGQQVARRAVPERKHDHGGRTRRSGGGRNASDPAAEVLEVLAKVRKRAKEEQSKLEDKIALIDSRLPETVSSVFDLDEALQSEPPEKLARETEILIRAADIEKARASEEKKRMPRRPSPPRNRTHWDYVVDEMANVTVERREALKWKSQLARKLSKAVEKHFADAELRQNRNRREAEIQLRRKANFTSKEVRKFWKQIEQVAKYLFDQAQEARKKAERDKQLDNLLGRTEKFTSMIADDIRTNVAADLDTTMYAEDSSSLESSRFEEDFTETDRGGTDQAELSPAAGSYGQASQKRAVRATSEVDSESVVDSSVAEDDNDFEVGEDVADDEATLDVEEGRHDGADRESELKTLKGEADLDLGALLRSQGIDPDLYLNDQKAYGDSAEEQEVDAEEVETHADDDDDGEPNGKSSGVGARAQRQDASGEAPSEDRAADQEGQQDGRLAQESETKPRSAQSLGAEGRAQESATVAANKQTGLDVSAVANAGVAAEGETTSRGGAGRHPNGEATIVRGGGRKKHVTSGGAVKKPVRIQPARRKPMGPEREGSTEAENDEVRGELEPVSANQGSNRRGSIDLRKEAAKLNSAQIQSLKALMAEQGTTLHEYLYGQGDESGDSSNGSEHVKAQDDDVDQKEDGSGSDNAYMWEDAWDDEETIALAEKEEKADAAQETAALEEEADLPLEEILRRSGVDPSAYSLPSFTAMASLNDDNSSSKNRRRKRKAPHSNEDGRSVEEKIHERSEETAGRAERRRLRRRAPEPTDHVGQAGGRIERPHTSSNSTAANSKKPSKSAERNEVDSAATGPKSSRTDEDPPLAANGPSSASQAKDAPPADPGKPELVEARADDVEAGKGDERIKLEVHVQGAKHGASEGYQSDSSREVSSSGVMKLEDQPESCDSKDSYALEDGGTSLTEREQPKKVSRLAGGADDGPDVNDIGEGKKDSVPNLLRGTLRNYQLDGMHWLITLYEKKLNGILADEMGLGKTIMTISLLAWLAERRGIWGPHLIVVPTSVMLNWEVEFKKWCPGLKVMSYFGSQKERRRKRQGWSKRNSFHVCITSYKLVVQDASSFRRKKWKYMILDEAQHIKNFQSQRWQTLLTFSTKRRLLLTGTPLQNSVMELWSLMHFLMPQMFESHTEFRDWFLNPINNIVQDDPSQQSSAVVKRLHAVLRPFMLRRLKSEVEKGLPPKIEHITSCPLSRRQRLLYEDFMARGDTQETLNAGNFMGVMNVLMQLRKVCNHPDLFEGRPIISPFHLDRLSIRVPKLLVKTLEQSPFERVDRSLLGLELIDHECRPQSSEWLTRRLLELCESEHMVSRPDELGAADVLFPGIGACELEASARDLEYRRHVVLREARLNRMRCAQRPLFGSDLVNAVTVRSPISLALEMLRKKRWDRYVRAFIDLIPSLQSFAIRAHPITERFCTSMTPAISPGFELQYPGMFKDFASADIQLARVKTLVKPVVDAFSSSVVRRMVALPDARLVQWDCGKLQVLAGLLRELKSGNHRCLIFTQMSRVLDVLESFLNLHAYRYVRLDGNTKTEERQKLMERFNTDERIFCFILTTRAGGVGLNLTGADCVIFYDNDWNPSVDAQAQDRAHRIGQTRTVHIYRLVSERTVEENILAKADQKRNLESLVIEQAEFNKDGFAKLNVLDLLKQPVREDPLARVPENRSRLATDGDEPRADMDIDEDVAVAHEKELELEDFGEEPAAEGGQLERTNSISSAQIEGSLKPIERYALRWAEKGFSVSVGEDVVQGPQEATEDIHE